MLTGKGGKAIATIGLVALGIGLFLGKLSWGLAIATGIGIMLIFGSGQVINWIVGKSVEDCPASMAPPISPSNGAGAIVKGG
jgi:type IV secretory pathway VirB2 component (pilin)